jgi:nucleoside-diphosphate-sugar epimerase
LNKVCITGAAGNLGSLTALYLLQHTGLNLNLMIHKKPLLKELEISDRVEVHRCDLNEKSTLFSSLRDVDVVVHYAGVLFQANPRKFLPVTNTRYFKNLVDAAKEMKVKRIILISFPHVEGETTHDNPATNRMDRVPASVHAKTRLEEERYLMANFSKGTILRVGMVYGRGVLMPDAARWFAKRLLLGVWKEPTSIHLISKDDFCETLKRIILKDDSFGIYNIGDEGRQTLQEYLDLACSVWKCKKPWRMPLWMIYFAAGCFETASLIFAFKSPLTSDFIDIGRISYYGDTTRMRQEILATLKYPTMKDGVEIF